MASIKNVYNMCKTLSKSACTIHVKLSAKNLQNKNCVQKPSFLPAFPPLSTLFPTTLYPLSLPRFIHYSTDPTTNTTINNLIERS